MPTVTASMLLSSIYSRCEGSTDHKWRWPHCAAHEAPMSGACAPTCLEDSRQGLWMLMRASCDPLGGVGSLGSVGGTGCYCGWQTRSARALAARTSAIKEGWCNKNVVAESSNPPAAAGFPSMSAICRGSLVLSPGHSVGTRCNTRKHDQAIRCRMSCSSEFLRVPWDHFVADSGSRPPYGTLLAAQSCQPRGADAMTCNFRSNHSRSAAHAAGARKVGCQVEAAPGDTSAAASAALGADQEQHMPPPAPLRTHTPPSSLPGDRSKHTSGQVD